jgi:hypothetical protein
MWLKIKQWFADSCIAMEEASEQMLAWINGDIDCL